MWQVNGKPVPGEWLDLDPVRVLYEFDGPPIFICKDNAGNDFLAYQCGEEKGLMRFIVAPCSDAVERALTAGEVDVLGVLSQIQMGVGVFDLNFQWQLVQAWATTIDSLPPNVLPKSGVMLWPYLPPVSQDTAAVPLANVPDSTSRQTAKRT